MNRKWKYNMAMYALLAVLMVGIFGLMAGLTDVARWGGYAEALPLLGLFVLFVAGNLIVTPQRRTRRR